MDKLVVMEQQGRICSIILNRPEVLNALNHDMFLQLRGIVDQLAKAGPEVGCVILRGEGKAFSAGHDLKDIAPGEQLQPSDIEASTIEALASLSTPVIAQVHGYCFTGALELALAADLIFTDEKTRLADTHSQWGLSPIWGMTQRLPRRVGVSAAKDMMFSSRHISATEALTMGLVDRVFNSTELGQQTLNYAETVTANSSYSHSICKSIIEASDGLRLHEGLDYEYTHSPGACADMAERLAAFSKKK